MRRQLYIPSEVQADIAVHVSQAVEDTLDAWDSVAEDEDVFTGDLGGNLRTRERRVIVEKGEIRGEWRWTLQYAKFRGRGPNASEQIIGADGIFELILDGPYQRDVKSLLFQSKFRGRDPSLVEQAARLSNWREAAFVMLYTPERVLAVSLDEALRCRGDLRDVRAQNLSEFIGREYVACRVGDNDLHYDARSRALVWKNESNEWVKAQFSLSHRLRATVRPPTIGAQRAVAARELAKGEVLSNRMGATPEDRLSTSLTNSESPKTQQRALAKVYHPDRWMDSGEDIRDLMTRRTQEHQEAYVHLKN